MITETGFINLNYANSSSTGFLDIYHEDRQDWENSNDEGADLILMQYTGLKDCHGKEIFQGDILKDEAGRARTVVFDYGAFKVMWNNDNPTQMNLYPFNKHWEVIGNIHENPEDLAAQPQKGQDNE